MGNQVGSLFKVVGKGSHEFPIGTVVRKVGNYRYEYLDGHDYWWVKDCDVELVDTIEIGSLAKVVKNTVGHKFKIGEIVRVIGLWKDGTISTCESLGGSRNWMVGSDNVVPYKEGDGQ